MPGPSKHRVLSVMHGPVFGGAHNQLVRLAPGLAGEGFEVVAAVPPQAEEAARRLEAAGIETVRMALPSFRISPDPRLNLAALADARRAIRALRGVIRSRRAAVVQAHGVINPHAGIAAHLEGSAVVWQLVDSRAPMALRRAAMPLVVRTADAITSWGRGLAAAHPGAESLGERLVVIYPPVEPGLAPDPQVRRRARERLGIAGDAVAIGTVGVRNSQKGHEDLVRAAALVKHEHPEAVFRVLGAPSPNHAAHMAAVEAEAARAGLLGPGGLEFADPGRDAADLVQGLDIFAMSSIPNSEGMPTVILEAMACAKPVVSTDVGSVGELVGDRSTGLLVPARDPVALAAALGRLAADEQLRERLGEAGRARAVSEFPLDELCRLHARAYRRAIEHRRGR